MHGHRHLRTFASHPMGIYAHHAAAYIPLCVRTDLGPRGLPRVETQRSDKADATGQWHWRHAMLT